MNVVVKTWLHSPYDVVAGTHFHKRFASRKMKLHSSCSLPAFDGPLLGESLIVIALLPRRDEQVRSSSDLGKQHTTLVTRMRDHGSRLSDMQSESHVFVRRTRSDDGQLSRWTAFVKIWC